MTPLPWSQPDLARALNISLDTLEELLAEVRSAASDDADRVSHALRTSSG
jgi:plasmid maintenance system antidote protein VapI